MKVAIVKYNAGNTLSVSIALQRLGADVVITDDPIEIQNADKVIFPGVGEASTAMQYLIKRQLDQVLRSLKQPFLGICLGLQLMCTRSEEGSTKCLGIFPVEVRRISGVTKIPHIGWNTVTHLSSPLFDGISEGSYVYFVHSYCADICRHTIGQTHYGAPFSAALHHNNFFAVQFHPEKSGSIGRKILSNFLNL